MRRLVAKRGVPHLQYMRTSIRILISRVGILSECKMPKFRLTGQILRSSGPAQYVTVITCAVYKIQM